VTDNKSLDWSSSHTLCEVVTNRKVKDILKFYHLSTVFHLCRYAMKLHGDEYFIVCCFEGSLCHSPSRNPD